MKKLYYYKPSILEPVKSTVDMVSKRPNYREQAEALASFMRGSLPGGTFDAFAELIGMDVDEFRKRITNV